MSIGYAEFRVLLSCLDWRLEMRSLPRSTRYKYASLVRSREFRLHLRFLKPLGVRFYLAFFHDDNLRRLFAERRRAKVSELPVPHRWYIHSVSLLGDGVILGTWFAPRGAPVDPGELPGVVYEADYIPVANCEGRVYGQPSVEKMLELGERLDYFLRAPPYKPRTPILAYLILAALDHEPMLTITELTRALQLLGMGDGGLRSRLVTRYYRELSERRIAGRVYALLPRGTPMVISAPRDCSHLVYGLLAATMRGAAMYVTEERVYAPFLLDQESINTLMAVEARCPGLRAHARLATYVYPVPYEMLDPVKGVWREEPVSEMEALLAKMRLVAKKG